MANIQLYIENKLTDYDENTFITMQKEFEDDDENIVTEVEYSYSISLPTSINNRKIFGFINIFDVPNKFSRLYNAELYVDEILILKGKLRLTEIDDEYFKGNLYNPALSTVSDILGDRKLQDITPHMKPMNSLSDFRQQNNYVMDEKSTDIPDASYRDRHVCYPYALYGLPYNEPLDADTNNLGKFTQNLEYGKHTMSNINVFPAFNVLSVIKDIFSSEGYTVQGNIFEDDKFKDLYQTYQGSYDDYLNSIEVPYYIDISGTYTMLTTTDKGGISKTLQQTSAWTEEGFDNDSIGRFDGAYLIGADYPMQHGNDDTFVRVNSDEQHMLASGSTTSDGKVYDSVITIPKSGWYRISLQVALTLQGGGATQDDRPSVSSYSSVSDMTSFAEQPYEFHLMKGYAGENPQLYSFVAGLPCVPKEYFQNDTVIHEGTHDGNIWVEHGENEQFRRFPKNGDALIIKNLSGFDTSNFICGIRMGGADFSMQWGKAGGSRQMQRPRRAALKGGLMALPKPGYNLVKGFNGKKYRKINQYDNMYSTYCHGSDTSLSMVREDSYTNFKGYNILGYTDNDTQHQETWNTTSNPGQVSYPGLNDCMSGIHTDTQGSTTAHTVVWLEKDETIYAELIVPVNTASSYKSGGLFAHSEWYNTKENVTRTNATYNIKMGFINSNKEWIPSASDPVPDFTKLRQKKITNVNKLLPNVTCNDYVKNFLQTFNLQLTMPSKNTFSIDSSMIRDLMTETISIDDLVNIKDAEFKTFDSPTERQLNWKIDRTETGYVHGNNSPFKTENYPWYESGYTGSASIINENNTSGTIEKKESLWSYNWYKTIKFIGGLGLSVKEAPIPVMASEDTYSSLTSYVSKQNDKPETSLNMRFFFLSKNLTTTLYDYIEFKYDIVNNQTYTCRLVIPTNNIITRRQGQKDTYYMLDYNNDVLSGNDIRKKTITDVFFNFKLSDAYQVDVPIKMTNDMYSKINAGTLIKLNDGLYRVKSIDGHDVTGNDDATLSLKSL